jgi:Reverse transcriptase (RNA-dependent DNA polymerase)
VPQFRPLYRLSPAEFEGCKGHFSGTFGLWEDSPFCFSLGQPLFFVGNKDGNLRLCLDYCALNKQTVRDRYPLPRINDLFDRLAGKCFFSKFDLRSGYHQVRVGEGDVTKTAFRTPFSHDEFLVMPFGLVNAPSAFQRAMNAIFEPLKQCFVVMDTLTT